MKNTHKGKGQHKGKVNKKKKKKKDIFLRNFTKHFQNHRSEKDTSIAAKSNPSLSEF